MYTAPTRIALIVFSLASGLLMISSAVPLLRGCGGGLLLAAALFTSGHFRNGTVWLAVRALRAGDSDRAERLLAQVRRPGLLATRQRACFELASGLLAAKCGDDSRAERHLRTALDHDLRADTNRCIAEIELAQIVGVRGDREEAGALIARARSRRPEAEVAERLEQVASSVGESISPAGSTGSQPTPDAQW